MSRRTNYDWPAIIGHAKSKRGAWVLSFPNRPVRLAKRIRLKQHPALRREDGELETMVLHEFDDPLRGRCGDIWVRWVPTPTEEERS